MGHSSVITVVAAGIESEAEEVGRREFSRLTTGLVSNVDQASWQAEILRLVRASSNSSVVATTSQSTHLAEDVNAVDWIVDRAPLLDSPGAARLRSLLATPDDEAHRNVVLGRIAASGSLVDLLLLNATLSRLNAPRTAVKIDLNVVRIALEK